MSGPTIQEVKAAMAEIKDASDLDRLRMALAKLWKERAEAAQQKLDAPKSEDGEP